MRLISTLILVATATAAVAPRWIRIQSANFEMSTTAGEGSARDTVKYFEQVRGFFLETMGGNVKNSLPISIVAFSSPAEFRPYRINDFAAAFYHAGAGRDYIVLGHTGSEVYTVAVHEYVHLLARHMELGFPPWLNEGIADLYSTLKPDGNRIIVGTPPPGRLREALESKWVPLSIILNADQNSPYYNEKSKAGSLYSEGWALTHMLMLGQAYRPGFEKFWKLMKEHKPSEEALVEAWGKPLAAIEKDVQAYIRQSTVQGLVFPTKLAKDVGVLEVSALSLFDAQLRLAEILNRPNNEGEARRMAEQLAAEQPNRSEPRVLLGYIDWHERKLESARTNFQKAFEMGSDNQRMLRDYGRLLYNDAKRAVEVFGRLLALDAGRVDARVELAAAQLRTNDPKLALATLRAVGKIKEEDAPEFFRILMRAEFQNGNWQGAKAAADKVLEFAKATKDATTISDAKAILEMIAHPPQAPQAAAPEGTRPAPVQFPSRGAPPPFPSITGSFIELRCTGQQATVMLDPGNGKVMQFLVDQPDHIVLLGSQPGTRELTCGLQKPPVRILLKYAPPPTGGTFNGLVRVLDFNP